jgi:hypothetical protein
VLQGISSHMLRAIPARKWPEDNEMKTMRERAYPHENYVL